MRDQLSLMRVQLNPAASIIRIPKVCFWELTDRCNLCCIHCAAECGGKSRERTAARQEELTLEEIERVALSLRAAGCEHVKLTGGEPLLRKDLSQIAEILARIGFKVSVFTNGLLVDQGQISSLTGAGVSEMLISLDGLREVHDAIRAAPSDGAKSRYDAAIRAIELAVRASLGSRVVTQIHKRNLYQLPQMFETLCDLGIDTWQLQIARPLGRLLEIREQYLIEPRDIPGIIETLAGFIAERRLTIAVSGNIGY